MMRLSIVIPATTEWLPESRSDEHRVAVSRNIESTCGVLSYWIPACGRDDGEGDACFVMPDLFDIQWK